MPSVTPDSLTALLSTYRITDSGDPLAVLNAIQGARSLQMRDVVVGYSARAKQNIADLDALRTADLVNKLQALPVIDNGANVQLGPDMTSVRALSDELISQGFRLPSLEGRNFIDAETYDLNGNLLGGNPYHLATAEEWDAGNKLPRLSGPDAQGVEIHGTTTAGVMVRATLYTRNLSASSTVPDIKNLEDRITARIQELKDAVDTELTNMQAATARMVKSLESDDTPKKFIEARRRETTVSNQQSDEQRNAIELARRNQQQRVIQQTEATPGPIVKRDRGG